LNNSTEVYELYPYQFYCPKCFTKRPYRIKPVSVKTRFYFISWFGDADQQLHHVVECQACKKGFEPKILSPSNQNYIKLACAARRQMLHGSSLESLKQELERAGVKEEVASRLILLAQI
jgi:hypothetical protein